jgi:hypothetical protein
LASASADGTVKVWELTGDHEPRTFLGHTADVRSVAFSPDGKRLASAGDRTVKIWDPFAGHELRTLKADTRATFSVVFSPDGWLLACGFADGIVGIDDARPLTPAHGVELEARALVDQFRARHPLQVDVVGGVQRATGITEKVRRAALRLAQQLRDNPEDLNAASWQIVRESGNGRERYREALRCAQEVCKLQPESGVYLNALGVGQYRTGNTLKLSSPSAVPSC